MRQRAAKESARARKMICYVTAIPREERNRAIKYNLHTLFRRSVVTVRRVYLFRVEKSRDGTRQFLREDTGEPSARRVAARGNASRQRENEKTR